MEMRSYNRTVPLSCNKHVPVRTSRRLIARELLECVCVCVLVRYKEWAFMHVCVLVQ